MALRYALLAALREKPATGYELMQRFQGSLAHVWNASHQQIYRELHRLDDDRWIWAEACPQQGKPDSKRYRITHSGVGALQAWLNKPAPEPATRDPFLVKFFAGGLTDRTHLREELDALTTGWLERLAVYRDIERLHFADIGNRTWNTRLRHLALRRGIRDVEACLEWSGEVRAALEE